MITIYFPKLPFIFWRENESYVHLIVWLLVASLVVIRICVGLVSFYVVAKYFNSFVTLPSHRNTLQSSEAHTETSQILTGIGLGGLCRNLKRPGTRVLSYMKYVWKPKDGQNNIRWDGQVSRGAVDIVLLLILITVLVRMQPTCMLPCVTVLLEESRPPEWYKRPDYWWDFELAHTQSVACCSDRVPSIASWKPLGKFISFPCPFEARDLRPLGQHETFLLPIIQSVQAKSH